MAAKMTSKEFEKNEGKERKRNLLYLMEGYMRDCCLHDAADALASEAQLSNQYELCDNVDLDMILLDYNGYYYTRFDKYPKIVRRINQNNAGTNGAGAPKRPGKTAARGITNKTTSPPTSATTTPSTTKQLDLQIGITNLSNKKPENEISSSMVSDVKDKDKDADNRSAAAYSSLCDFEGYSSEWRETADLITKEIVRKKHAPHISWSDCVGLEHSVELLREAVVYPRARPEWFEGLLAPWKGILLYGPPGTGKTLLARALAAESDATFINVTISTFVSKWRGESEKMLKVLFDVARLYAPTTIFIDELDALASRHEDQQHEASRRFKSELLIQLDGLLHGGDNDGVFVLATTNAPWNLCGAVLRRFEKRILVSVPEQNERSALFRYYFDKHPVNNFAPSDYQTMAEESENFSGADIKLVCREAAMCALREKLCEIDAINDRKNSKLRPLTMRDVRLALSKIRQTSDFETLKKYANWKELYGCA